MAVGTPSRLPCSANPRQQGLHLRSTSGSGRVGMPNFSLAVWYRWDIVALLNHRGRVADASPLNGGWP
jgi:hypothetical protein